MPQDLWGLSLLAYPDRLGLGVCAGVSNLRHEVEGLKGLRLEVQTLGPKVQVAFSGILLMRLLISCGVGGQPSCGSIPLRLPKLYGNPQPQSFDLFATRFRVQGLGILFGCLQLELSGPSREEATVRIFLLL